MDIDLNLLRVFDALMELRSVTRAADRLGLTQSAISHALGRLRTTLGDPLFTRSPHGLQPTARAMEMTAGVRDGLARLNQALFPLRDGQPATQRRFTIAAGTYFCAVLIPSLIERAYREAPEMTFGILPFGGNLAAALDRGTVDLVFGAFDRTPGRFVMEPLHEDEMVWIAATGSAITKTVFDAQMLAHMPRIVIAPRSPFDPPDTPSSDDLLVSSYVPAATLDDSTTVYDSQTAIAVVATSDMVATVPRRLVERTPHAVTILGSAGERRFQTGMLWHSRERADPGLARLRALIRLLA